MLPRPRKRFGQHFLTDRHYLDGVVRAIDPRPDDSMVEIGPGTGLLTAELVKVVQHLHVIEIDRDLAAGLRGRYAPGQLAIHEGDALDFDFATLPASLRVVGNLPYNVSTPILFRIAEHAERIRDCTFMLQREVVDRMVAAPDTADYGRLSVMLQYRFEMERVLEVPPEAFTPPPRVDSAVVCMRPLPESRRRALDEGHFARLVAAAFSQRRKTLRNAARALVAEEGFAAAGIDPVRRGETLSVGEFIGLSDSAQGQSSLQSDGAHGPRPR
ncbi:MAG: 16S rRNA (adenine(1518)-N(6)/adenine(1519)-N(6))-dimethyltransferase RsmA [Usitatibacter sp.]